MSFLRNLSLGVVAMVSLLSGVVAACTVEQAKECQCPAYTCANEARLTGEVAVPAGSGAVRVKYCKGTECLEGSLDLSKVQSETTCAWQDPSAPANRLCFTRDEVGKLHVVAGLAGAENADMPADGDRYTFTVSDGASGDVLLEEARQAGYTVTRKDCCHQCWQAEMRL